MKKALAITAFCLAVAPIAAWSLYKPVRVLAPQLADDISCPHANLCIDDSRRTPQALALYEEALDFVSNAVGPFRQRPRIIFCATQHCFQSFGFNRAAATTVGTSGIVVSPRGWKAHYIRHEMIHHRQAEELGVLTMLFKPEWLIEGMAYALSDDPRSTLSDRWQSAREQFVQWYTTIGKHRLWQQARTQ